jgi:hypothetical protein
MTPTDWLGISIALMTLTAGFTGAVRWLVKHYLSELKPDNNGQHNLEGRIAKIEIKLDTLMQLLTAQKK